MPKSYRTPLPPPPAARKGTAPSLDDLDVEPAVVPDRRRAAAQQRNNNADGGADAADKVTIINREMYPRIVALRADEDSTPITHEGGFIVHAPRTVRFGPAVKDLSVPGGIRESRTEITREEWDLVKANKTIQPVIRRGGLRQYRDLSGVAIEDL